MAEPSGAEILTLAGKHLGEKYLFGVLVPKDNPKWTGPWDCAEFVSWVIFQVAGELLGCSPGAKGPASANAYTGYFADQVQSGVLSATTIDEAAATAGAIVLRIPAEGAIGHVVFSDGAGGTIEAHSSRRGVIAATLSGRRWDRGIRVPTIKYERSAKVELLPPPPPTFRLVQPPMAGNAVMRVQRALRLAGYDPGRASGAYDAHTQAAVRSFQLAKRLLPDGEVGSKTLKALGLAPS